jgi:UDP-glucose 4-epimerase
MSFLNGRVLVTGGAGFIGSHVVDSLIRAGLRPRIYDTVRSPYASNGDAETVIGDILDISALRVAMHGCQAVVHLAAMADVNDVARRPGDAERVNAQGTVNVLEAAGENGVKRVVYASTIWAYSDVDAPLVDEDTPLVPPSHVYTATKVAGELYCRSYGELYDLEYTILRFGIPYGPRARPAAVVPTFVNKALAGEPLTISGGGKQSRRFVYVEDLAEGVVRALRPEAANRIYNLVGTEDVTIKEVAEVVGEKVGSTKIVDTPARNADFKGVEVSGERAAEELDWRASTPFSEGVERYVEWHREQAAANDAPAPVQRRLLPGRGVGSATIDRITQTVLVLGIAAMAAALIAGLGHVGTHDDALRMITISSLIALTLYAALSFDRGAQSGVVSGLGRLGWLVGGGVLMLLLGGPFNPLHLVHSSVEVLVLSSIGACLGVGTGVAARRLLRERMRERAADSSG